MDSGDDSGFSGPSYTDAVRALRDRVNRVPNATGRARVARPTTRATRALIISVYRPRPGSPFFGLSPVPRLAEPPVFDSREASIKYYIQVSKEIQRRIITELQVCPMSREETITYNIANLRRLERVRLLEQTQELMLPRRDMHIEQTLFSARLDYRTRMYRTFRMNDLPVELIQNIFRLVCWSACDPNTNVKWRVQISSVCRLWRNCLISDGTIWSAIWFRDTPDFERSFTWLERAGQAPIDVRINDSVTKPWTMEQAKYVVDNLFLKLSTLRILIVVLHEWDPILYIMESLARVAASGIPMSLERLEVHRAGPAYIQMGTGYTPNFYNTPIPLFGGRHVPSFKYITMNGCHVNWSQSFLKNLTTLDIRRIPLERAPTIHEFRAMLLNAPQMTKLVLDGAGPKWPTEPVRRELLTNPIMLPRLKTLILGDFSLNYGAYLLSQFLSPNVIDLTLMNLIGEDYAPLYHIMTNRMPNILSLTIYGAETRNVHPFAKACIIKWLKSMPKVGFLRIKNVTQEYMNLFNWDASKLMDTTKVLLPPGEKFEDPVCPQLKTVEVHAIPAEIVRGWAVGRAAQGVPFRKLYVGSSSQKPLTSTDRAMLEHGVLGPVVVMSYPGKPLEEKQLLGEI